MVCCCPLSYRLPPGGGSWGLWQINVEPNQYDPDAIANDLHNPPTGPAVAMETFTIAHEGYWRFNGLLRRHASGVSPGKFTPPRRALDIACLFEAMTKGTLSGLDTRQAIGKLRNQIAGIVGCCACAGDRPRHSRAAEQRDELAPVSLDHLVGAGASDSGTSRPSALAVLRLKDQLDLRGLLDRQVRRPFRP